MSKPFRTFHGDYSRDEVIRSKRETEKRKKHVLKVLAGWVLIHNSVDFRVVKRFRFWQVRILKERVIAFKRILRTTNRNYLSSRLRVVLKIFKFGLSATLATWRLGQMRVELPMDIRPQLAAGKFGALVQRLQAKKRLYNHFQQPLGVKGKNITKTDLALWSKASLKRAFLLWLSRAYKPEPLLRRKYQLLLQTRVLLEKRLMASKVHSWRLLKKHTAYPFPTPLSAALKPPVHRLLRLTFHRLRQFTTSHSTANLATFAGFQRLRSVVESRIDQRLQCLWAFATWKYARKWGQNKEGVRGLKRLANIGTRKAFYQVVMARQTEVKKGGFDIDKNIIGNQALLLVHLERELSRRTREAHTHQRAYRLQVLCYSFHTRLRSYFHRWTTAPSMSEDEPVVDKEELFSYLQELESKIGLNQVPEGEEELSGSRFSDFESIRAKMGRLSADSGALDYD